MRKKLFALALATTVVLSFAACGSKDNNSAGNGSSSASGSTAPSSSAAAEPSSQEDDSMTLADWFETDDAAKAKDAMNVAMQGQGMTVDLLADGNMLVYEYHLTDDIDVPSGDALDAAFGPVIEAYSSQLDSLFSSFDTAYGIKLEGVRFVFVTSDGTELYSGEVANE